MDLESTNITVMLMSGNILFLKESSMIETPSQVTYSQPASLFKKKLDECWHQFCLDSA